MTSKKGITLFLLVVCILCGCEKIDIDEPNDSPTDNVIPTSLGLGTQNSPYTIEQVQKGEVSTDVSWFIGYVVGSTYSTMSNAIFEAETTYTSNILLSSDSLCQTTEKCVPVELGSSSVQKKLSLPYHSECFRQCVMVKGQFLRYFRTNGVRNVVDGYFLPSLSLSTLKNATPAEWQEWHEWY